MEKLGITIWLVKLFCFIGFIIISLINLYNGKDMTNFEVFIGLYLVGSLMKNEKQLDKFIDSIK